ncbi:T9SS type A sorting domain-containing protein [Halpernia frigidisoli]|uniref:Por secretion system C-terminal sorting domain-containing protein n=1 Tax=Halpernia frigidisoli TaxID=1125876 RepID=A0A1I3DGA0_9FLAO|nr:T9SS type A sorting domain-containing protein [Halpernia frigidisoli]SFH85676.1 Por secretion system C-terminal sorting domain-containing protein [Halpernia frigidisoli]
MKKNLFSLFFAVVSAISVHAQTTVNSNTTWDFGNAAVWTAPPFAGVTSSTTATAIESYVNNLGFGSAISASTGLMGAVASSTTSGWVDNYTAGFRMQMNGGSGGFASGKPTSRYLFFPVSVPANYNCNVKVWFKSGSTGTTVRTLYASDGTTTNSISKAAPTGNTSTTGGEILSYDYPTNGSGTIYIYADTSIYLYKMVVTFSPTLGTSDSANKNAVKIFSTNSQVSVSNITDRSDVKIYSMNGGLVKSLTTNSNIDVNVKPGIYIVNVNSAKGNKSVKVSVK